MELGVRPRAWRHRRAAVAERAAVGRTAVTPRVPQHLAAVELVQRVGARARRQPHRAGPEQFLQLAHDAEDADPLVLVDVVEIADGDDPLGRDGLVVGLDALRDAGLAELVSRLWTKANQFG